MVSWFNRIRNWTYTVPSSDVVTICVGLQAAAAIATVNGCGERGFCHCIELDYDFRLTFLITFYTLAVLIESAFADNVFSWVPGYPLLIGTFVTAHVKMPRWMYGTGGQRDECPSGDCGDSIMSLHLGLIVAGTASEAGVAALRSWRAKHWITFWTVVVAVLLYTVFFIIEQSIEDTEALNRARGILSPTLFVVTRTVAMCTIEMRRIKPPDAPKLEPESGPLLVIPDGSQNLTAPTNPVAQPFHKSELPSLLFSSR